MVNRTAIIVAFLAVCMVCALATSVTTAQSNLYTVDHEWSQIFINQDGTIDLIYNITLTVTQGTIHAFDVGQPNRDFTLGQAIDQYGNQLNVYSFTPDVASVDFEQPLKVGDSIWYTITTNVSGMIYNDTMNPGNYGMQFIPQWISDTAVSDVRVQIVLPPGVTTQDVKTTENFYNGTSTIEGNLAIYWEIASIAANQQVTLGLSFPASSMPNYTPSTSGNGGGLDLLIMAIGVFAVFAAIFIVVFIIYRLGKNNYTTPKVSMETLGIKRGLTAVEASYLLDLKPTQIVTEILYSLLQKRAVWAEQTKPSLKLRVLAPYENKTGSQANPLRYYEIDFLSALKPDGTLDEEKLAQAIMFLRDSVDKKLEGYSRKDTVDYYRKIVAKAWGQVEQAGTPELASNAYNQQMLWLMMDPNQRARTETVFRDRPFRLVPCGSGGGMATLSIIHTPLTYQILTPLHSQVRRQRFQVQNSPTTSRLHWRKPPAT